MALEDIGVATYHMSTGFSDIDLLPVNPGLLAFFGRSQNGGLTEFVDDSLEVKWDVVRGDIERERLLVRSSGGMNVGDNAKVLKAALFTTESSIFPQVTARGAVEYAQLFKRVPNELPSGELTKEQRMRWLSMQIYGKMLGNIGNTLVVKGWESVRTGKMTLDDGSGDFFDWRRAASNTAAAGAVWTTVGTDILTDIDTRCDKIQENGKVEADFILPGVATWAGMKKNTQLVSEAENRGYLFIRAGGIAALPDLPATLQWMVDAGLKYQAWIQTPAGRELFVLTSNEKVKDPDTGLFVKLMPDDEVLFGWSGARCDWKSGPAAHWNNTADDAEVAARMGIDIVSPDLGMEAVQKLGQLDSRMFHILTKPTATATWFEMQTNPLLVTNHADAFALLTSTS
ncbi:MAG: hypothetical protein GWP06_00285 [Actinobacteria bacterium]|nr:hypothetical protein [Actinomycetota bacterium]